ncbi:hypothetical protein [Shewanella cyperi]|nr:hypothetical protein [Shewanella cyperi]
MTRFSPCTGYFAAKYRALLMAAGSGDPAFLLWFYRYLQLASA